MTLLFWICSSHLWHASVRQALTDCHACLEFERAGREIKWVGSLWTRLTFRIFSISKCKFLWFPCLVFKIEIFNPSSNLTWSKTKWYLSKDIKLEWCLCFLRLWILHQAPKQRVILSVPQVGSSVTETQHPWYHSADTDRYFLYVELEVRFVIAFTRNFVSSKKCHFSWMKVHPFSKATFEKSGSVGFSELDDARNTGCFCRQTSKSKVSKPKSEIHSSIHLTQREIVIVHKIQIKPKRQ